MKKLIALFFVMTLVLSLAACSGEKSAEKKDTKRSEASMMDVFGNETGKTEETAAPTQREEEMTEETVEEIVPETTTAPEATTAPETDKPHTHSYTSTTEAATCEKDGRKVFTCQCGDSYTEAIAMLGHSYSDKVTAPTCTEKGYTTHTCTRCNYSYTDAQKNATNHSYTSQVTTAATCTKEGVKTYTCTKCADKYTEAIAKTAHNYVAATCSKPKTCACGATTGSAAGHSYTYAKNTTPTTSATGSLKGTCSRCSATTSVTLPKLTTTDYNRSQTTAPTCTATGTYTWTWKTTTYGTFSYTTTISATGHVYAAATCSKPKTCACGATTGSALGHNYSYAKNTTPTTSATGSLKGTCSRCSGTTSVTLPKLTTTDYNRSQTAAPTCTATGTYTWTWKTTTYGTYTYTSTISAKGHSWSSWKTVDYPSPIREGRQERVCSVCSSVDTKKLAKSQYDGDYAVDPDYTGLVANQRGRTIVNVRCMWWENGTLMIDGYFYNDTNSTVTLSRNSLIEVKDGNGNVIAGGYFDLSHITLGAKQYTYYQVRFLSDCIYVNYGSSLDGLWVDSKLS